MKSKILAVFLIGAAGALAMVGCSDPCGDLAKKKADCAKASGPGSDIVKSTCEASVDATVKTGNKDSCTALITNFPVK